MATSLILGGFIAITFVMTFILIPVLWAQTIKLVSDLPHMFNQLNEWLLSLPENYPELVDYQMIDAFFISFKNKILGLGESALKLSIASLLNLVTLGIYAFLVPLMVFFLLKDKTELINYITNFLPKNRTLASKV